MRLVIAKGTASASSWRIGQSLSASGLGCPRLVLYLHWSISTCARSLWLIASMMQKPRRWSLAGNCRKVSVLFGELGQLVGKSTGLLIERLRVWILAGAAGEFSSPELTLCADPYSVSVPPPVVPHWHAKDPGHSAKSAGGRSHLNMHAPLTQWNQSGLTMPWSRHGVGTYPEMSPHASCQGTFGQSSQLSMPLWTDPGVKSGISVCELISTPSPPKKKKK